MCGYIKNTYFLRKSLVAEFIKTCHTHSGRERERPKSLCTCWIIGLLHHRLHQRLKCFVVHKIQRRPSRRHFIHTISGVRCVRIMGCLGKSNMHSQLFFKELCDLTANCSYSCWTAVAAFNCR